jgi:WD40 repeat protein
MISLKLESECSEGIVI